MFCFCLLFTEYNGTSPDISFHTEYVRFSISAVPIRHLSTFLIVTIIPPLILNSSEVYDGNWSSVVGTVTMLWPGRSAVRILIGPRNFSLPKTSISALWSTQPAIQSVLGFFPRGQSRLDVRLTTYFLLIP